MRLAPLLCLLTGLLPLQAQLPSPGELSVFPNLLLFEGTTRNQEIRVQNIGKSRALYRILFQAYRMREDGHIEEAPELPCSAAPLLRFSPRQVELAPGEIQTVRMQLRRPEHLEAGEYRIHLLFRAVPDQEGVEASAPHESAEEGLSARILAVPGVAVPITVRHGRLAPAFALEEARLEEGAAPHLSATLVQKGKIGLRGRLVLYLKLAGQKQDQEFAAMDVVHYGDLPRQCLRLPLPPAAPPLRALHAGTYTLVLRDEKGQDLCTSQLTLLSPTGEHR